MIHGTIVWDFDGTLAYREGMWSGTLLEILRREVPGTGVTRDQVRPFIRSGFPWHTPDVPHPETTDPDLWWARLNPLFERAFVSLGADPGRAAAMAGQVRADYCDPSAWRLFDDTMPVLSELREAGWRHVVLSNHVPELPGIASALGLDGMLDAVHSSASTGYEKPNPEAFRLAVGDLPEGTPVLMVGDSLDADVLGAERAGIPAVLVRKEDGGYPRASKGLAGVLPFLGALRSGQAGK